MVGGTIAAATQGSLANERGTTVFDKIEWLWKTRGSGDGDCPSLMRADGGYVVVGRDLDADSVAQIRAVGRANHSGVGSDETAVFVPADVIDRIRGLG